MTLDAVAPALSHLTVENGAESAQRWMVGLATERDRADARQGIFRLSDGGLAMVERSPFSIESFEPAHGISLVATPAGFAAGDLRAHPGAFALSAWLAGQGLQVMHAAAVAFGGRGVLLVGPGGAGKTTSALACALAGGDFLGDDLCLIDIGDDPDEPARIHSLFATVKLNADSARRLGAGEWARLGTTPRDKVVFRLPAFLRTVVSASIAAIVVLAPSDSGPAEASALRPAAATRALAATGHSLASGAINPALWFAAVTRLARRVPAFRLPIGWDLGRLATGIRRIADEGGEPSQ